MKTKVWLFIVAICFYVSSDLAVFSNPYSQLDITEFVELQRLGEGSLNHASISPDNSLLAVSTGLGVWIYEIPSLNLVEKLTTTGASYNLFWLDGGKKLASTNALGGSNLWDTATWQELFVMEDIAEQSYDIVWSPSGKLLAASGSFDEAFILAKVYDAQTGEILQTMRSDQEFISGVYGIEWSDDETQLLTTGYEATTIWDITTGDKILTLTGPDVYGYQVSWSPDQAQFAIPSFDSQVHIYDSTNGDKILQINHADASQVHWSPDGTQLMTVSQSNVDFTTKQLRVWDSATGDELFSLVAIGEFVWSEDGSIILFKGDDEKWHLVEAATGDEIRSFDQFGTETTELALSSSKKYLLAFQREALQIVDLEQDETLGLLEGFSTSGQVIWMPNGTELLVSTFDSLAVLDAETLQQKTTLLAEYMSTNDVRDIALSPDGRRLATYEFDTSLIRVWDLTTEEEMFVLEGHEKTLATIVWSPDGAKLASGGFDPFIIIWDMTTGEELHRLRHENYVLSVTWSQGGGQITFPDSTVKNSSGFTMYNNLHLWNVETGQKGRNMELGGVSIVAWSPDDRTIAIGDGSGGISILTIASGALGTRHETHTDRIEFLSWSPDGSYLASASADGKIGISNDSGNSLVLLEGHGDIIRSMSWSPDGTRLVSTGSDGTLRLWGMPE